MSAPVPVVYLFVLLVGLAVVVVGVKVLAQLLTGHPARTAPATPAAAAQARGGSAWYLLAALPFFAVGVILLAARGTAHELRQVTSPDAGRWEAAAAFWLAVAGAFGLAWACFDRWRQPAGRPDGDPRPRTPYAPVRVAIAGLLGAVALFVTRAAVSEYHDHHMGAGGLAVNAAIVFACLAGIWSLWPGRPRPAGGGLSPREKRMIAGVAPIGFLLTVAALVLGTAADGSPNPPVWLAVFAGLGMIGFVVLHRRLSRWAYPEWWANRDRLLYPDRPPAAPAPAPVEPAARPAPPQPLPAFKWPDDERSRAGQRWLAVILVLGIISGLLVMFTEVIPKAGWSYPAVMLYVIALTTTWAAVAGLLRWGFRKPSAPAESPRPTPVARPAAEPPADAGGSPRTCPKCGAAIAADAPQGLCPKCLMQAAFSAAVSPLQTAAYAGPFVPPPVEDVAAFFPQLEILGFVGRGGMGAVYKARQPALDRVVALKLIRPNDDDPTFAERFSREAKALAKLSHPNIVTIHEFGEAGGSQYLLMEFVDGVTLRDAMRAKAMPPPVALKVIGQICGALQFAHEKGVVHRDIKPENILLAKDGTVKIADFGLAKVTDPGGVSLTRSHQAMGTPHYMAPEQWEKPAEVDHRADIYALGVVFYELLTGELPLGRFDPPSQKVQIDVRIDEVVLKALAKEPGRRYQAVVNVRTDLEHIGRHPHRAGSCGPRWGPGLREYKSKATVFGWPLVHIVDGIDPVTGRTPWAKGVIAIGGKAIGVVAVGGMAVGGLALGGCAVGVVAVGGGALGAFALGGMAVGLVAAVGGMALGGLFAAGGQAVGYFAAGGHAVGVHTLDGMSPDAEAFGKAIQDFFGLVIDPGVSPPDPVPPPGVLPPP